MPSPKWLVIAKNEYRVSTSRIRRIRPYSIYLVTGLLAVYVAFIAPSIVNLFLDDFLSLMLSQFALAMVQIVMFTIFIYFTIIPISSTLREAQAGQLEILLAAPVTSSDVLLGEFMGRLPFYAIFMSLIAGLFTALLNPLGLDSLQIAIIITMFVVIFLSALWVGNLIAALLRAKLGKTARGKDIGRGLAMIMALPIVALMYAMIGGGLLEALASPGTSGMVSTILGLLPSSWGAEVIIRFASNPGNIGAFGFETLTRFVGIMIFFVAVLWLGAKVANRAYNLEPTSFIASRVRSDGAFYKTLRHSVGGGSFGTILVSIFKDYGRRLENLSNISYIVGIVIIMNIFLGPSSSSIPDEQPIYLLTGQFMLPIITVMVVGDVTVRGKENLFIYRKTPFGESRYVRVKLLHGWIMVIPIATVFSASLAISSVRTNLFSILTITGLMIFIAAANVPFIIGLFCLNPALSEKSPIIWLNIIIAMFVAIGLFLASVFVLAGEGSDPIASLIAVQLLQTPLSWFVGIVILYLGQRRLSKIE